MVRSLFAALIILGAVQSPARAETPEEWIALGTRVHGGFGSFIPLGIRIGLDAVERLKVAPRQIAVTYYDGTQAPCACFADGIAIATLASVGQRSLTIATDKAPQGVAGVAIIRAKAGGSGLKYTIPMAALGKLGPMNQSLDPRGRYDAVMKEDGLFMVEAVP